MRTKNAIRNLIVAWAGQIAVLLCNFVSRSVFVKILPGEYLGISGLFSNILSMLSLVDLGIGVSIAYYLYEPLANQDEVKICRLMNYFKRMYTIIGTIVFVLGISLTPILEWFIKENLDIPNLKLIYVLYVSNSALTYFSAYKTSLINADQKNYIVSFWHNVIRVLQTVMAIVLLVVTKDYIVFYSVTLVATIAYNFLITGKANSLYPYLSKHTKEHIDSRTKDKIKKNTTAMMCHKIGNVLVNSTDNLLISKFVSIVSVGLYSNYSMILTNLNNIVGQIFSAMTASIGNYNVSETDEKKKNLFYTLFLLDFEIYNFCSICLFVLFNPFIKIWLGDGYVMSQSIVAVIVLNNYLQGTRKVVLSFKDACGLFQKDKYKALAESVINLVVSILLVGKWGIVGVFAGTTVSFVTTCLWVEPYVLFRYGLKASLMQYFKTYLLYLVEAVFCVSIAYKISSYIPDGVIGLLLRMLVCGTVWMLSLLIFHGRTSEFKTLLGKFVKRKSEIGEKEN